MEISRELADAQVASASREASALVIPRGDFDRVLVALGLHLPAELSDDLEAIAAFHCLQAMCAAAAAAKRPADAEALAARTAAEAAGPPRRL